MREDYQRVYAKVDLDAVRENAVHIRQNLPGGTKVMAVVKADGYGHGAVPIAGELESYDGLYGFAVATAEEALILRKAGIRKPILVLGYTFPYSYKKLIEEQVRMVVFREDTLTELKAAVRELREKDDSIRAKVHIKVDTGMSRIGIRPDETGLAFVKKLLGTEGVETEGILTHFARADEADQTAAVRQYELFRNFIEKAQALTGYRIPVRHCDNSAAIIGFPKNDMDVARAGIILYGLWPSKEVRRDIVALQPVLSLYSRIVYIKEIEAGTAVSYGGTFVAPERMRIATIPVGYGDGYPRGLSGKGYVLIHGQKAPILGRICMDQFMVDISRIESVKEGDPVTLIGNDGGGKITMEELSELSGRFNYELACDLGRRIPRVYEKGGKILSTKDYYEDF